MKFIKNLARPLLLDFAGAFKENLFVGFSVSYPGPRNFFC